MRPTENYEEPIERATLISHMFRIKELICNIGGVVNRLGDELVGLKNDEKLDDDFVESMFDDSARDVQNLEKIYKKLQEIDAKIG